MGIGIGTGTGTGTGTVGVGGQQNRLELHVFKPQFYDILKIELYT